MRISHFVRRNLAYYWRTNLAVVSGVAVAVAVLAGALLVGASVRASLRELFLQRVGETDQLITAQTFFRERLADEIASDADFAAAGFASVCPLVVLDGAVTHEASGRRAGGVQVYGVDERFWKFHGRTGGTPYAPAADEILLSASLADELKAQAGEDVLLRVEKPSDIPVESLHGRKEDVGRTLRLTLRRAPLAASELGEFSVRPQQAAVRAVFVSLVALQRNLERTGAANALLVAARVEAAREEASKTERLRQVLRRHITLEDMGVKLRALDAGRGLALESESGLLSDTLDARARDAARRARMRPAAVLSYLANTIRSGARETPYSVVTALDAEAYRRLLSNTDAAAGANVEAATDANGGTTTAAPQRALASQQGANVTGVNATDANATGGNGTDANVAGANVAGVNATQAQSSPPATPDGEPTALHPIILNEWAADDLGARVGDAVTLEYFVWQESGRLSTESAQFRLAAIVPLAGAAADRDLVPEYPGITEAKSLADWEPPFPVELSRIRPRDEEYWNAYRTTPKAFITLERGQALWQSRFGRLTSLRLTHAGETPDDDADIGASAALDKAATDGALDVYRKNLREVLDPSEAGVRVDGVRAEGLAASRGATDFGEYFLYFSFFLVVSALLLVALFFKLGIEQRLREIGTLQAIGLPVALVRRIFLAEGVALALAGSLAGVLGAYAYGELIMHGLRTWWVGAVGTTALELHASPASFVIGAAGGIVAALACIWWTMRSLRRTPARALLSGSVSETGRGALRGDGAHASIASRGFASRLTARRLGAVALSAALLLLAASALGRVNDAAGFFGGGTLALVALLCFQSAWLRRRRTEASGKNGWGGVARLGARNATARPGRSLLCITLIASAVFIVVAVDAFRRGEEAGAGNERKGGTGGFALLAETLLPVVHDPNTPEGREALNLPARGDDGADALDGIALARFRLKPGDDASCLNLYQPRQPRILAPTDEFVKSGRFRFQSALAATESERENAWLLLEREYPDGATPIIADANSLAYVLHLKPGEDFLLERGAGREPLRLRVVAALADSLFQGELLMSEKNFLRHFPEQEGYRFFLIDLPARERAATVAGVLETSLADFGFDVTGTNERLASFHRVENTYLSTFQMLGMLGLALGTLGLAAVLLRNVLERRRELALLRAIGYDKRHFALMVIAENALLLCCGLLTGTACALVAIAPVVAARGGQLPFAALGGLLVAVVASGLLASLAATVAALHSPLLAALRAE